MWQHLDARLCAHHGCEHWGIEHQLQRCRRGPVCACIHGRAASSYLLRSYPPVRSLPATGVPLFLYTIAISSEWIAGLFHTYATSALLDYGLRDSEQAAAMDTIRLLALARLAIDIRKMAVAKAIKMNETNENPIEAHLPPTPGLKRVSPTPGHTQQSFEEATIDDSIPTRLTTLDLINDLPTAYYRRPVLSLSLTHAVPLTHAVSTHVSAHRR